MDRIYKVLLTVEMEMILYVTGFASVMCTYTVTS